MWGLNAARCWAVSTQTGFAQIPCMCMHAGCVLGIITAASLAELHMQVMTSWSGNLAVPPGTIQVPGLCKLMKTSLLWITECGCDFGVACVDGAIALGRQQGNQTHSYICICHAVVKRCCSYTFTITQP